VTWLSEAESLAKLGITTDCCSSCASDAELGYAICEAYTEEHSIECCCIHADALQTALDEGRLS